VLAHELLSPALKMNEPVQLICLEGDQDHLSANKINCILTEQPLQLGSRVKAYNHLLIKSGFTFFAAEILLKNCNEEFPQCLSYFPWLMQSKKSAVRTRLSSWLEK
jgi:LysR family transcriptional activator of nhaA